MTVWVVTVDGRVDSLWFTELSAIARIAGLKEVNGDALVIQAEHFEVRE